ncbi:MAG: hypothetical protein V4708_01605 [Bacteroidota bacterium]
MNLPEYNLEVFFSKDTLHYTDLPSNVNPIPTDSIIYKTITGIGATYSEVIAERNSIIVLPHISIVKAKHKLHRELGHDTLAVYGEITMNQVKDYIEAMPLRKKIFTTPAGLEKIKLALIALGNHKCEGYFLLLDECHKQIMDAQYREDMLKCMETFFEFNQKAMISATPVPPSDPRFIEHNFQHVKLTPEYDHKKTIRLIHSNSIVDSVEYLMVEEKSEGYFIFFNSINGIQNIVENLQINSESALFCSNENSFTYKDVFNNVYSEFDHANLKKYNFFTSSFYNGFDINIDYDPTVFIITDLGFAQHSIIDPYTDAIQIIGRFRDRKCNTIHINNSSKRTTPVSELDAIERINLSKQIYTFVNDLKYSATSGPIVEYLKQQQQRTTPYATLLTRSGQFSYFKQDNYLNEQRIKSYYAASWLLKQSYSDTNLFLVKDDPMQFDASTLVHLSQKTSKYSRVNIIKYVESLQVMELIDGTEEYYNYKEQIRLFLPVLHEAYHRLGIYAIADLDYKIKPIKTALLKLDKIEGSNSNALIEAIYMDFNLNVSYTCEKIKLKLAKLYDAFDHKMTAMAPQIEHYFHCKFSNRKINGVWQRVCLLLDYKFAELSKYRRN